MKLFKNLALLLTIIVAVSGCSSTANKPGAEEQLLIDSSCNLLESAYESWNIHGESTRTELGELSATQVENAALSVIDSSLTFNTNIADQKTNNRGPFFMADLYMISQSIYTYVSARNSLDYEITPGIGTIQGDFDRVQEICSFDPSQAVDFDSSSLEAIAKSCSIKSKHYKISNEGKSITFTNADYDALECFLLETVPEEKDSIWSTGWGKSGDGENDKYFVSWENNGDRDPELAGPFVVRLEQK